MKKLLLFILPVCICFSSCKQQNGGGMQVNTFSVNQDADTLHVIKTFKGLYMNDGKNRIFISCEHPEQKHLIENNTHQADTLFKSILPHAYPGEAIYMEMQAEINPSPDPAFTDLLIVKQFEKAEMKSSKNTCIPYNYWCSGTEPFWQLQISAKEKLIDFYDPMTQTTTHFPYTAPQNTDGLFFYTAKNAGHTISVNISPERCNGARDLQYTYKAKVTLDNKQYTGCAEKYR